MLRRRLDALSWKVGFSRDPDRAPERFVPATAPGAVQLDWAAAEGWPPYWQDNNPEMYGWMEDVHWLYRAALPASPPGAGMRRHLVLKGVDYEFTVRTGGVVLHHQEGMFAPVDLDITERTPPGAVLEIAIRPAPKFPFAHRPKAQASRSCKPAVSYGWDWHPRLIPLGIWDEAFVEDRPAAHLQRFEMAHELSADLGSARLVGTVRLSRSLPGGFVVYKLFDPDGALLAREEKPADGEVVDFDHPVAKPRLWWPNGQGDAALYRAEVALVDNRGVIDETRRTHGFRRVRLVMNEGAWEEPSVFPKSRSTPPITMEINGRRIFAKGTNWVNPEIFPGLITAETYRPLIDLAHAAHFNILRTWGGAIVNKESFFDLCDQRGLMVWQEFPLACNDYADDPHYLRVLDRESRAIIERLRAHPSVCLWCGGNELFNVWSGMTDQHKSLRLLNRNCFDLDPETPFLPTSPVMGMGHGDYRFRDERGREVFQIFAQSNHTAYTEFGCPGPSDVEVLRSFIPEADLFPPRPKTAWETHHAMGAWGGALESWLFPSVIEDYFGPSADLEELVRWGQLLQAEGYRCLYEEARRQKPRASMALNWCWNEPWPAAANNSLVTWPCRPKPAYQAVKAACRPVLASARLPRFSFIEGDLFSAETWILNDAPVTVPGGRLHCDLVLGSETKRLLSWRFDEVAANRNLAGPVARVVLPALAQRTFQVALSIEGRPELDSVYTLCFRPGTQRQVVRVGLANNA
jgi:beta-mannosidase